LGKNAGKPQGGDFLTHTVHVDTLIRDVTWDVEQWRSWHSACVRSRSNFLLTCWKQFMR